MPDCQFINRKDYEEYKRRHREEQQLREEQPLTTPATPATRRTLPNWVVWGVIHLTSGLLLLEILNWAARPH